MRVDKVKGPPTAFQAEDRGVRLSLPAPGARMKRTLNVKDFPSLQHALDAAVYGELYFPPGDHVIESTLKLSPYTKLFSDTYNRARLILAPGFSPSNPLAIGYQVNGVEVDSLVFSGGSNKERVTELASFFLCKGIKITNSMVENTTHIGLAFGGCVDVSITNSKFSHCGRPAPTTVSSPAVWIDKIGHVISRSISVRNNIFYRNNWSAIYLMADDSEFINNYCENNGESTVFSAHGNFIRIEDNRIYRSFRSHISGSGLELGGNFYQVRNNYISYCAADGIALSNSRNSFIENNICFNNGQDIDNPGSANFSGIGMAAVVSDCSDNYIVNNRCFDDQVSPTQAHGIFLYSANPETVLIRRAIIANNNVFSNKTDGIRNHQNAAVDSFSSIYGNIGRDGRSV